MRELRVKIRPSGCGRWRSDSTSGRSVLNMMEKRNVYLSHACSVGDGRGILLCGPCPLRLIHEFQHTDGRVMVVGVDLVGNPVKPLICTIVVVAVIESRRWIDLSSKGVSDLCTRCSMQPEDNIEPSILCPANYLIKVLFTPLREVLAGVDDLLIEPIAKGNADSIEAIRSHLREVAGGHP